MPQTAILASLQLALYHALLGTAMGTHEWQSRYQRMIPGDTHMIVPVKKTRLTFSQDPEGMLSMAIGLRWHPLRVVIGHIHR